MTSRKPDIDRVDFELMTGNGKSKISDKTKQQLLGIALSCLPEKKGYNPKDFEETKAIIGDDVQLSVNYDYGFDAAIDLMESNIRKAYK